MATTTQMITKIHHRVGTFSRPQILSELEDVVRDVLSENTIRVIKIDPLTGMPPYLVTTAGVRNYTCPVDCAETAAIFIETSQPVYLSADTKSLVEEYLYATKAYQQIAVNSTPADEGADAEVTFVDDPGDSTTTYYHLYYVKPVQLSSENIQIPIPLKAHREIEKMVLTNLKWDLYGDAVMAERLYETLKRKVRNKISSGAHAWTHKTQWREECRDGDYL